MLGIVKGKKIFDFALLRRVFQYAAPYKKRVYISISLSILLAVISPLRPLLIQITVNDYIRKGITDQLSVRNQMIELLIYMTIIQIVFLLLETIFRFYFS